MPDVKARYEILKVHSKKVKLSSSEIRNNFFSNYPFFVNKDVDLERIARGTAGFSGSFTCLFVCLYLCCSIGADLANLINQSALKASKDGKSGVTTEDIEFARDKIIMGTYHPLITWVYN